MTTLTEFVRDFQGVCGQVQEDFARKLATRKIGSWEEYQHMTGQIEGLRLAADLSYQLMKNKDMADDGLGDGKELGGVDGTPAGGKPPPPPPPPTGGGKGNKGNKRARARS